MPWSCDKGIMAKTEKIVKINKNIKPVKYRPKKIPNRETGRDKGISTVPFSISPAIPAPAKETSRNITIIGQIRLKCSTDKKFSM